MNAMGSAGLGLKNKKYKIKIKLKKKKRLHSTVKTPKFCAVNGQTVKN